MTTVYLHLPFPSPDGLTCAACGGSGITGSLIADETEEHPDGVRTILLVDVLCPVCLAGLRPDFAPAGSCDSCQNCRGRQFWISDGWPRDEAGRLPTEPIHLVIPCRCSKHLLTEVPAPAGA